MCASSVLRKGFLQQRGNIVALVVPPHRILGVSRHEQHFDAGMAGRRFFRQRRPAHAARHHHVG